MLPGSGVFLYRFSGIYCVYLLNVSVVQVSHDGYSCHGISFTSVVVHHSFTVNFYTVDLRLFFIQRRKVTHVCLTQGLDVR